MSAKKGHELLKRKADALKMRNQSIMKNYLSQKTNMGKDSAEAFIIFAKSIYAAGDYSYK